MKKFWKALAAIGISAALCVPLAACGEDGATTDQERLYESYVLYAQAAGDEVLSYQEWLDSVRGAAGEDGKSAYEIAVENGFEGTEEEWLASLKGQDGEDGKNGADGDKGDKGDAGEKGEQGDKGDKGDPGEKGDQGDKGDPGEKGEQGVGIEDITYSYGYNAEEGYFYTEITFILTNKQEKTVIVPSAMNPETTYVADSVETFAGLVQEKVGKIRLETDLSLQSFNFNDYQLELDLNDYTLELTSASSSHIANNSDVTIKNGTIAASGMEGAASHIVLGADSMLTLDSVNYTATGTAIWASGANAKIVVSDSTIASDLKTGGYAISTNASLNQDQTGHLYDNIVMELSNSIFSALGAAIMLNVNGTLNASKCSFIGEAQGIILRAGTANITDCTLGTSGDEVVISDYESFLTGDWKSGNNVPCAAIVVGNRNGTYFADAVCNLSGKITIQNTTEGVPPIYVYENAAKSEDINNGQPFETKLDYSAASGIKDDMIVRGDKTEEVTIIAPDSEQA